MTRLREKKIFLLLFFKSITSQSNILAYELGKLMMSHRAIFNIILEIKRKLNPILIRYFNKTKIIWVWILFMIVWRKIAPQKNINCNVNNKFIERFCILLCSLHNVRVVLTIVGVVLTIDNMVLKTELLFSLC